MALLINYAKPTTDPTRDSWLAELVNRREVQSDRFPCRLTGWVQVFIMPATNALGYYQNVREENHIDPNRDFG